MSPLCRMGWLLFCLVLVSPIRVLAGEAARFEKLRYMDVRVEPSGEGEPARLVDRIKLIPLPIPDTFLSLGGEIRLRYDYRKNPEWGQGPQDPYGAFLQRYLLYGDLEIGDHVRVFGELRSALEDGRAGPPSQVEVGPLDVQQAFVEVRNLPAGGGAHLAMRVGRQEVLFGSERLVSVREGPNIRRRFDGIRGDLRSERIHSTAIAAWLTEDEEGVFTDGIDFDVALWGLYNVLETPLGLPTNVDLYYLGARSAEQTYVQGTASELRHTLGMRVHGVRDGLGWNWEFAVQWGRFGAGDILAWTVASETGYRLSSWPFAPRLVLGANVASGDRDPDDADLETFNPLFPRGNYFSHLALLGPRNFMNLHPGLELELGGSVSFAVDANFYWRLETSDGIYGPSGNILRQGLSTDSRYVGPAVSWSLEWAPSRFFFAGLIYTHGFAGPFVQATGPAEDIDFVELTLQLRF